MKSTSNIIGVVVLVITLFLTLRVIDGKISVLWITPLMIFIGFTVFQHSIKTKPSGKKVILSPWNMFSTHSSKSMKVPVGADLLFEKVKEEVELQKMNVKYIDQSARSILITKPMSMFTWGENVYLDVVSHGEKSELLVRSATPGQIVSWGRNDTNIHSLMINIEDSFTI